MNEKTISGLVTGFAALLGVLGLGWWVSRSPLPAPALRVPLDHAGAGKTSADAPVVIEGEFHRFGPDPGPDPGLWPAFRGPHRDNLSHEETRLSTDWGPDGPPVLWSVDLGEGHAGAAVRNGRVYVLDHDDKAKADTLRCFALESGREIWKRWYGVRVKRNHGMSRTVPAVDEKVVVTIGPKCHVLCVDARSGAFRWGLDLVRDYGATVPLWYTGQCPLLDGPTAVLAPAGRALLLGVDTETGKILWETPNPRGWKMSHSCVMPMTLLGHKTYVYCAIGGIVGVSAEGEDRGKVLFESDAWKPSVVAPSPVFLGHDRFLITSGYGAGSLLLEARKNSDRITLAPLLPLDKTVFACEQHTPLFYKDRLYTVLPNDAGPGRRQLVCMSPEGERLWASGKTERFGLGPFLIADDKLFVLADDGTLTAAKASGNAWKRLAQARVLHGRDAWGPIALTGGRMILRDWKRMICIDLRKKP
jgi:outer membrane protein assembly factor BamB